MVKFCKIVSSIVLILIVCLYGFRKGTKEELTAAKCLKSPQKYTGSELFCNYWEIKEVKGNSFKIQQGSQTIWVELSPYSRYALKSLKKGEIVSVKGIFCSDGKIELEAMHIHKFRKVKENISLFAFIFVLFLFFSYYRFNFKKFILEEKGDAGFSHSFLNRFFS
jgi:hypothetical protein